MIKYIKHFFDKFKKTPYNEPRETLIRKMFPGIHRIDDKKTLNRLLASLDDDFIKVLNTYYRSEVNMLIEQKRYSEIEKYEGIKKLISDLKYLYSNPNN